MNLAEHQSTEPASNYAPESTELSSQQVFIVGGMPGSGYSIATELLESRGITIAHSNANLARDTIDSSAFSRVNKALIGRKNAKLAARLQESEINANSALSEIRAAQKVMQQLSLLSSWGFADEDTALCLDFWQGLLSDAHFILVFESPWDAVDRILDEIDRYPDIADPLDAIVLWIRVNQRLLSFAKRFPNQTTLISSGALMERPQDFLRQLRTRCWLSLPSEIPVKISISGERSEETLAERKAVIENRFPEAARLYESLMRVASLREIAPLKESSCRVIPDQELSLLQWSELNRIRKENKALHRLSRWQKNALDRLQTEREELKRQRNVLSSRLEQLKSQMSGLQEQVVDLSSDRNVLAKRVNGIDEEQSRYVKHIGQLEETCQNLSDKGELLANELLLSSGENRNLQQRVQALCDQRELLQLAAEELAAEIGELKASKWLRFGKLLTRFKTRLALINHIHKFNLDSSSADVVGKNRLIVTGHYFTAAKYSKPNLRIRIGKKEHPATYGLLRRDIFKKYGDLQQALNSGFRVDIEVDKGQNTMSLEFERSPGLWIALQRLNFELE